MLSYEAFKAPKLRKVCHQMFCDGETNNRITIKCKGGSMLYDLSCQNKETRAVFQ